MNPKIEEIVATLRTYAPDEDGTSRYILIPAAGRGATAEYPVTVRSHRTDIMRDAANLIEHLHQELIDERYRHDRYADFCVAQGEELSALKTDMEAIVRGKVCGVCAYLLPDINEHCARCSYENSEFKWRDIQVPVAPKEDANENAQG